MGLEIDSESVIHEHLVKKLNDVGIHKSHDLTMLSSFHISLGSPPSLTALLARDDYEEGMHLALSVKNKMKNMPFIDVTPIIGDITLAPIVISEKDNKKAAWIPLNPLWFDQILSDSALNLDDFDSFDHRCDECPVKHLHVSVANKVGHHRYSISRPENCIISTATTKQQ
jgi:hypothetical protein